MYKLGRKLGKIQMKMLLATLLLISPLASLFLIVPQLVELLSKSLQNTFCVLRVILTLVFLFVITNVDDALVDVLSPQRAHWVPTAH